MLAVKGKEMQILLGLELRSGGLFHGQSTGILGNFSHPKNFSEHIPYSKMNEWINWGSPTPSGQPFPQGRWDFSRVGEQGNDNVSLKTSLLC